MSKREIIEKAKKNAAYEAIKYVKNNYVIGLGSGSTVALAIKILSEYVKSEKLNIKVIPSSYQAFSLAVKHGISLTTFDENPILDLTIDGADQIDKELNLIKGGGAALTREKIVASASKKLIIIADETKKVEFLGEKNHPIPIEVLPFALPVISLKLKKLGGNPILREGVKKVGPLITDNGNFIIDTYFGIVEKPLKLLNDLKSIPGVFETGLFIKMTDEVILGNNLGIQKLFPK